MAPRGGCGRSVPFGCHVPPTVHGWAPREGLWGSHVTHPPRLHPALGAIPPVGAFPHPSRACPGWSWGSGLLGRGEGQADSGGAQPSSHRASDPQAHPGAPQPWLRGLWFNPGGTGSSTAPCPLMGGVRRACPAPGQQCPGPPLAGAFQRLHPKAQLWAVVAFPLGVLGLGAQRWERPGRAGLTQARGLQVTWNKSTSK